MPYERFVGAEVNLEHVLNGKMDYLVLVGKRDAFNPQ